MKKLRVLHVMARRPVGGVGTFLKNMNMHIDLATLHFDYILGSSEMTGEFDEFVSKFGSRVFVLPEIKSANIISYFKKLISFMEKNASGYDVIHIHTTVIALPYLVLAKKYGIKLRIIHSHSIKYSDNFIKSVRNYALQMLNKDLANAYFACSNESAELLFKKEFSNKQVTIIRNAVDLPEFAYDVDVRRKMRKNLNIENNLVVGQIGSFLPVKNHNFSLDILSEMCKLNNKALMLFVGDGELEKSIVEKTARLGLSRNVIFLGRRRDIKDLLQAMDVMIMPSFFEGVPLVGIEAQASGLPIVFSDTITKDLQIISPVKYMSLKEDPRKWAEIILDLYKQKYNREIKQESFKSSGYDIGCESKRLEKAYKDLLDINK